MRRTFSALFGFGLALVATLASGTVHYKVTPENISHSVLISITIDSPKPSESFHIPAWCPGYYQIANYQKNIFDIKATNETGKSLTVKNGELREWRVQTKGAGKLTFSYRVQGNDAGLGFFGVNVQSDKAFINGAGGFMYVEGRKTEDTDLQVKLPLGWEIATAMDPNPHGGFRSQNYDEFIDHPIQLGKFQRKSFSVNQVPFEVIFVAPNNKPNCDLDAETERLRRVSAPALKMFRGSSFKRYLYILHLAVGDFGGGLEHRACNVQAVPNSPQLHLDDLAAHEYFHAWNVKQIRPVILGPFDYTKAQHTNNLWFAEGVTDYYSKLHTYQSGLQNEGWLKNQLSSQIDELQRSNTRKINTVEEASYNCWDSDGFGLGDLSYYTKGLLAGLIFDACIIDATNGKKTLDDLLRLLYERHKLPNPGYGEDELRTSINEVAGIDLSDLYKKMIRSTDEMPYDQLAKIGLKVTLPDRTLQATSLSSRAKQGVSIDLDPEATTHAKMLYQVWLHRLNGVR